MTMTNSTRDGSLPNRSIAVLLMVAFGYGVGAASCFVVVPSFRPVGLVRDGTSCAIVRTARSGLRSSSSPPPPSPFEDTEPAPKKRRRLDPIVDWEEYSAKIRSNVFSGQFGTRGEVFVLLQVLFVSAIVAGVFPVLDTALMTLFGPVLFVLSGMVALLAISEMGTALSPWPKPAADDDETLITDGILFGNVRHPLYSALLSAMCAISIMTGSSLRLLLTGILYLILDKKADYEEHQLIQRYGAEYINYRDTVKGKFVPTAMLQFLDDLGRTTNLDN